MRIAVVGAGGVDLLGGEPCVLHGPVAQELEFQVGLGRGGVAQQLLEVACDLLGVLAGRQLSFSIASEDGMHGVLVGEIVGGR